MKSIRKRIMALALAVSMAVTAIPGGHVSAAVKKPSLVRTVTVTEGKTATLKVKNLTKGSVLKWSSSNKKIAAVSKKGVVKAVKPGTATVMCKVKTKEKKNYTLKCKVKVQAAKAKTVTTQAQLDKALKNKKLTKLTLKTTAAKRFVIKKGNYGKVKLVVDAPNADVENSGVFKSVTIRQIKADTWYEQAAGNAITVTAPKARIVVAEQAFVDKVAVAKKDAKVKIEILGTVKSVAVSQPAAVTLEGQASVTEVAVTIAKDAAGTKLVAAVPVAVSANASADITLQAGAENSKVSIAENRKDIEVNLENNTAAQVTITAADGTKAEVAPGKDASVDTETDSGAGSTGGSSTGGTETGSSAGSTGGSSTGGTETGSSAGSTGGSSTGGTETGSSAGSTGGSSTGGSQTVAKDLSYVGYDLKWEDEFEGTELNRSDWNVELHEPGWVNAELQAYVDSAENIQVKDGNLVIKPVKKVDENGKATYTSGRVNTQNKHDFTYGLFEVKARVPEGMGYLPAFWMMPINESLYGQWPRCGEIDIMEVMGQANTKLHGTIHYGNPHAQSQGTYELKNNDNFTDNYHVFSCEWEPGSIKWYVDGILYHEENDWYSKTEGKGTVSYPAPFDQPFYMILNLAVGGSWVGYPDENTTYENQAFTIDYVRAYQKTAGYDDSNVQKPVKDVVLRDPDASGNYINNGNFAVAESLADDKDWKFMTANGGEASAEMKDNSIVINTTNGGTVDYSVQLVQAGVPLEKGATYEVAFDAQATEARTMKADVKAPDYNYMAYMPSMTVSLTAEKQTFNQTFKMTSDSDANGRLEFNMGKAGTAGITISNVSIKKTKEADPNEEEKKTVLSDGNHVYNGSFDEGDKRLGYWEIKNADKAQISVTDLQDGRRLKVVADSEVMIGQSDLALAAGKKYAVSFDAQADAEKTMKVVIAGKESGIELTAEKGTYSFKLETAAELTDKDIWFTIPAGTVYLDNVRIDEDAMIKNGSFNAGTAGFEVYVDGSAGASYVVDSQEEDNALDFTINNAGDAEWKIQLKQTVALEKDKWYTLSFDIKSSIARSFQYAIQRDGSKHKNDQGGEDWTPYVQATENLNAYGESGTYTTITKTFQMKEATDEGAIFNIALGGGSIAEQHRVCIDNISLNFATDKEIQAATPKVDPKPANQELLSNTTFADDAAGWVKNKKDDTSITVADNAISYAIKTVGSESYENELKQENLQIEKGGEYQISFDVTSTVARSLKCLVQQNGGSWTTYMAEEFKVDANESTTKTVNFTMDKETDTAALFAIDMGKVADGDAGLGDHTVTISNVSLKKVSNGGVQPSEPAAPGENMLKNPTFADGNESWTSYVHTDGGADAAISYDSNAAKIDIKNVGEQDWNIQLKQTGFLFEKDCTYKVKFKVTSTKARKIKLAIMGSANDGEWLGGADIDLKEGTEQVELEIKMNANKERDNNATFQISMGKIEGIDTPASTITISDLSLVRVAN